MRVVSNGDQNKWDSTGGDRQNAWWVHMNSVCYRSYFLKGGGEGPVPHFRKTVVNFSIRTVALLVSLSPLVPKETTPKQRTF